MFIYLPIDAAYCLNWAGIAGFIPPTGIYDLIYDLNLYPEDDWASVGSKCRSVCNQSKTNKIKNQNYMCCYEITFLLLSY